MAYQRIILIILRLGSFALTEDQKAIDPTCVIDDWAGAVRRKGGAARIGLNAAAHAGCPLPCPLLACYASMENGQKLSSFCRTTTC